MRRIRPFHLVIAALLGALLQQGSDSAFASTGKAPGWGIGESAYRMANALERIADCLEKKK